MGSVATLCLLTSTGWYLHARFVTWLLLMRHASWRGWCHVPAPPPPTSQRVWPPEYKYAAQPAMSRSNDPGHYFQTTSALEETARKAAKSNNTHGSPIKLQSKILAICADPQDANQVYVAEAAGNVKRINIEVDT